MGHVHGKNSGHNHDHHHGDLKGTRLGISILLNILITLAQAVGGLLSGSLSLLSDALHNFSDVIALVISYIADRLTKKEYTAEQTYGYRRAEVLAALINAASLIAIAILLAKEAIVRFNEPVHVDSLFVIVLAGLSILVNGGSVLLLRGDAAENMNMKSAYLHLMSDMFTSVGVLAGGIAMYAYGIFWLDSVISLVIAAYLIGSSIGLLNKTLRVLMQFTPAGVDIGQIKGAVQEFDFIDNMHHVHVWQLNDTEIHFEAHLDFSRDMQLSAVSRYLGQVNELLSDRFGIHHALLQPEFGVADAKQLIVGEC